MLTVLIVLYVLVVPTIGVFRARSRISSAVASASAIRLEEYLGDRVLTTRALTSVEFSRIIEAVPATWDYGMPGMMRLCFVPHHRIIITDAPTQRTTTFEVCFSCNQLEFTTGIIDSPSSWHQPLRQLFLRHDIPIRNNYSRLQRQSQ
jgi:hypothetical protein